MKVTFDTILERASINLSIVMGDGVSLSYPLPDLQAGRKTDRFFLYQKGFRSPEGPRPFAMLTLDHDTGEVLSYTDARLQDFMGDGFGPWNKPISYALDPSITIQDLKMEQTMLRKLYEGVRRFAFQDTLTDEEKEILRKFVFLMEHAGPNSLQPYYRAIGENFYRWVKEHA